jgi:hypothetical protein
MSIGRLCREVPAHAENRSPVADIGDGEQLEVGRIDIASRLLGQFPRAGTSWGLTVLDASTGKGRTGYSGEEARFMHEQDQS